MGHQEYVIVTAFAMANVRDGREPFPDTYAGLQSAQTRHIKTTQCRRGTIVFCIVTTNTAYRPMPALTVSIRDPATWAGPRQRQWQSRLAKKLNE